MTKKKKYVGINIGCKDVVEEEMLYDNGEK